MTTLATIRQAMTAFLAEAGSEALSAWPKEVWKGRKTPVAVVQVKEVEAGASGFQNYLGQTYDPAARQWTERYGRRITVKFGVTLYSPEAAGESGCQALLEQVAQALMERGPAGFAVEKWSAGETAFDQASGMFWGKLQAVCRGMLVAGERRIGGLYGERRGDAVSSMVTTHERPGVYSVYAASAVVSGAARRGWAAVAARSQGGTPGKLYDLGRYEEAETTFGKEDALTALVKLLMANGAARVLAVPVEEEADYPAAFALLGEQESVKVVVCDSQTLSVQQALRDQVLADAQVRRERIAVVPGGAEESVSQLVARAKELNSERVVLVAPGISEEAGGALVAAAVAGAICGEGDPALPLGGVELRGIPGLALRYGESELDTLLQGGVTPVELAGGVCSVVRGVTTRTTTGGVSDSTWRELTTILVVDDVIPGVRNALRAKFPRAKNTAQTRGAVRSQVILELERKLASEIITGYGEVTVQPLEEAPTVCLVTFSFTVAHGLNQIWLSAQITV